MASKGRNLAPPSETSDLASLWARAVSDYEKKTGSKLAHMKVESLSQVMDGAQSSLERFQDKRHPGSSVDRVRNAFGNHLGGMQKFMAGVEAIGAAAGAFPPAMPVGIVFMAAGRLLSAFAGVKADFDKVEAFFDTSTRFFERLSIIENKGCNHAPLKTAIVRVFSAHLSILAMVETKVGEKHLRMKQWMNAVMSMEDEELAAAYGTMQQTVDELAETVGYSTLAEIKDTQGLVLTVSAQADHIDENIRKFRTSLQGDVRALYESNLDIKAEFTLMRATTESGFTSITEQQKHLETVVTQFHVDLLKKLHPEKSKPDSQDKDKKKQPIKSGGKGDAGDKKSKALRSIKAFFDEKGTSFPDWRSAQTENTAQHQEIRNAFITHTGEWLASSEQFEQWTAGENPLLWIRGPEGVGKSFLVDTILQKLSQKEDTHTTVVYFHFKEDFPYLQSAHNALACATLQVADSNTRYAETVAAKLKEEDGSAEAAMWQRFFLYPFGPGGPLSADDQLYIAFDGLDEAPEEQRKMIMQFIQDLKAKNARIRILVTSQPEQVPIVEPLEPLTIEVTKAKMLKDIKLLISSRLRTLPRLRKFSTGTKKLIRRKVGAQADGMLYVEHMLRRLSYIGREGAVRKDLDNLPTSLHALYKLMLDECRRDRMPEQYEALKKLFAWLAFSKRSLNLAEASELVKLTIADDEFDIEAETIGRSARILELSGPKNPEEDDKDDTRDDSDDEEDDKDSNLDNQQRSLTFQERSLRQYFKTISVEDHNGEELRTPASAAHLTILTMSVDILMKSAQEGVFGEAPELRGYAVSSWHEHFNELDPENASSDQISQVLALLYRIVNNEHNIANMFERLGFASDLYPDKDNDLKKPWYDRLQAWAIKGTASPDATLEPPVKEWVQTLAISPGDILVTLAQGHVRNWLSGYDTYFMKESYGFAKATLKLSGRFESVEGQPLKEIQSVANAFSPMEEDFRAMRAIGIQLYDAAYEVDEDKRKELQTQSIEYLQNSIDLTNNDSFERGGTLLGLTTLYARMENNEKAVETLERAMKELAQASLDVSPIRQKQLDGLFSLWFLHCDKAEYLAKLDNKDAALDEYNEARKLVGEQLLYGWQLDDITLLFDEKNDPQGRTTMTILKSWSKKERDRWFSWHLQYGSGAALGRMYRAAKMTKETDEVLEWLAAYEKTLAPQSLTLFNLKTAYAEFYEKVLQDGDKAREALRSALQLRPKLVDGWEEDILNERISTVRMDLAGIIFSQFMTSPDPDRKEALLEELRGLPGMKTDDEFRESHIGMLLANMYRIMGPAREYYNQMTRIFQTCIAGLEDDVSWNDGDSLRLLAKVLSSLDGLERDARITISSQFSVMDPSVHNAPANIVEAELKVEGPEGDTEDSPKDAGSQTLFPAEKESLDHAEDVDLESVPATKPEGNVEVNGEVKEAQKTASIEAHHPDEEVTANGNVKVNGESQRDEDTSASKNTADTPTANGNVDVNTETGKNENSPPSDEPAEISKDQAPELTGDLNDYRVGCDGCDRAITQWSEPFYLCLICPNIDLCEDCHTKRLAWNRGQGEKSWTAFCAENHHYIKGPMKGWKGIKNGVIQIDDTEILVKDWIKGLKEDRWPKAWEKYWRRQGGLKDIGVED
ncbi:hypothetical protein BDV96DRAFT_653821 [Lophiotrema nucula]|uniref:Uncharacterized protein n=1 Tax=Lophiotrema nucula TaxID=690887 RepID=A0A6A5YKK6_9PLEO|nr:hypothetical protein BDV96DRAFT_653821 [Lophiotrema nucula]